MTSRGEINPFRHALSSLADGPLYSVGVGSGRDAIFNFIVISRWLSIFMNETRSPIQSLFLDNPLAKLVP